MNRLTRYLTLDSLTLDSKVLDLPCRRICKHRDTCTDDCIIWLMQHKLAGYENAEEQGLSVRLPVPIGERVYTVYEYTETDGIIVRGVEETHMAGFINEDSRPFYLCYSPEYGSSDIEPNNLYTTRQDAEAALAAYNKEASK